jgi:pSer/pThr/pTyr-binding forkhead associated (FHA) protein
MKSGILLEITRGPDAGRKFRLDVGHYRVIGRAYGMGGGTAMMPFGERRRLDAEDQRLVVERLRERATPALPGARTDVASFTRDEDIDLSDDAVSQAHAMVFCDEAGASFVDVSSTNGTSVNGNRIVETAVVPGDLIRLGETRIEVKAVAG